MNLLLLCWEFFQIGLFAVGGGLATLPFLTDLSQRHPEWVSQELLANIVAIGESTPGPIGVNMATYVGYETAGILGAIAATFSLVLPSLIIIMIVAMFLQQYKNSAVIQNTFSVLRPAVTGLIAAAGFSVMKLSLLRTTDFADWNGFWSAVSIPAVILFALFLTGTQLKALKKLHPIVYIAIGAVAGVVFQMG